MKIIQIEGGRPLMGSIQISGSKNTSLPILAASLILTSEVTINNVPNIMDVSILQEIISDTGATCIRKTKNSVTIDPSTMTNWRVGEKANLLRGSIWVVVPMLKKFGQVTFPKPGGCKIGQRPIDLHLKAFARMGAIIEEDDSICKIKLKGGVLTGCEIEFESFTVGGTQNVMMAGLIAKGTTVIKNASKEPEVVHLGEFLNGCGAEIEGLGTETITIKECPNLTSKDYTVAPDRLECGGYAMATIATRGECEMLGVKLSIFESLLPTFEKMGISLKETEGGVYVSHAGKIGSARVQTAPYPGFPTDLQAPLTTLLCLANGVSTVHETIYENRFLHVPFLNSMGANIILANNIATITPVNGFIGQTVQATDIRSSKALIIAGLVAKGTTIIEEIGHVKRGYEEIVEKLINVGAKILEMEV